MLIKQMSKILNETFFPEATGTGEDGEIFTDDLSNVATLGTKVVSSTTLDGNLNQYLKTIYDKVGQTIYRDEKYTSGGFDIVGTDAEYGSVLEKIRIEAPDFDENKEWTFDENGGSTHEEMFGYHPLDVSARYFNSRSTFATKPYTQTEEQARSAFTSKDGVIRFFSAVEARVKSKRNLAINILTHKAVIGLLAEKLKSGKNVYKLLNLYREDTGDNTVTNANWKTKKDFLIWASTFMNTVSDIMYEPTALYNEAEYISQTDDENRRFYLISDMSRALESYVYRDSFNKEEGKLRNFKTIAYWQSVGKNGSYTERSAIRAIPISEGTAPAAGQPDNRQVVSVGGVVGAIFSKFGCMVNAKEMRTAAVPNTFDNWINYKHSFNAGYFVDTDENAVVFIMGDDPDTVTMTSEAATETLFGKQVSALQTNINTTNYNITGTLHEIEGGLAQSGPLAGTGYFIALKFSDIPSGARVFAGLSPSTGTGLVELDSDLNGVWKITNINSQDFVVRVEYANGTHTEYVYNLDEITLD